MSLVNLKNDTPLQQIKRSFLDDRVTLSPSQLEKKNRIRFVQACRIKKHYSKGQTLELLQKEYDISQATAYRIYKESEYIIGDIDAVDLKAEKSILREQYHAIYQLCLKKKDYKTAIAALNEKRALFDFDSINDTGLEDGKLKSHVYKVVIDRETKKQLKAQFDLGVLDLNDFPDIEDADYREVEDDGNS